MVKRPMWFKAKPFVASGAGPSVPIVKGFGVLVSRRDGLQALVVWIARRKERMEERFGICIFEVIGLDGSGLVFRSEDGCINGYSSRYFLGHFYPLYIWRESQKSVDLGSVCKIKLLFEKRHRFCLLNLLVYRTSTS